MVNKIQENSNKIANQLLLKKLNYIQKSGVKTDVLSFAFTDVRNKTYIHFTTAITWGLYNLDNNIINLPNVISETVREGFITNCNSPFESEARKVLTQDNVDVNNHAVVLTYAQDNGYVTVVFNCVPNTVNEHTKSIMKYAALTLSYEMRQLMEEYTSMKQLIVPIDSANIPYLLENHQQDCANKFLPPAITGINKMPSISVNKVDITGDILYYIRTVVEGWSNEKRVSQGLSAGLCSGFRKKIKSLGFSSNTEFIKFLMVHHVLDCIPNIRTL